LVPDEEIRWPDKIVFGITNAVDETLAYSKSFRFFRPGGFGDQVAIYDLLP
jgi:hypothetical protein